MTFYEIEFPLSGLDTQLVEEALLDLGASSITYVDRGDEPVLEPLPGEFRLWSDSVVRGLFGTPASNPTGHAIAADAMRQISALAARLGPHITATARLHSVEDRDWLATQAAEWQSLKFGQRLWICPTAATAPLDPGAIIVRLNPGLAFGTGTHPTTALCLQLLDSLQLSGRSVIDYGCGSGILGIAALKLGAAHVTAVDIDPQALLAARDNALRNGVSSDIEVQGVFAQLRRASCVVANILAGPLIELAPILTDACEIGGDLILSGLLGAQTSAVIAAYAPRFECVSVSSHDGWCCIHARRCSSTAA